MQLWNLPPAGTDRAGVVLKTTIPNALDSLRTLFSGTDLPTETAPFMLAVKTGEGLIYQRNAGDTAWNVLGCVGRIGRHAVRAEFGGLSATAAKRLVAPMGGMYVERLVLISDTLTSSSSGNEWQVALRNVTQGVDLFSGTVGTYSSTPGIGGGAELAVDTAFVLLPDQNLQLAADDVLRVTLTAVGTVTTITELAAIVEGYAAA